MIAYHFPPLRGSSGIHRTLAFCRYLKEDHGWLPTVLTIHPRAYPARGDDLLGDVPEGVEVIRAFGLDSSRHLSIGGRYLLRTALPDNWATWRLGAVGAGRRWIRRHRPAVIWSTFPIATAHAIGLALHRKTGVPWVADFRDSMTEENYPPLPARWRAYRDLEAATVRESARSVFVTPGARAMYAERYPDVPGERWAIVPNGYDERPFEQLDGAAARRAGRPITLVHSGLLYRSERDPRAFFAALGEMKRAGELPAAGLRVVLRASGDEDYYREHLRDSGIDDVVFLEPPVAYREALREMMDADGLLLFQASNCNHQIPAKLYEYFRARRPILALTDPVGDTASEMRAAGTGTVVRLDRAEEIRAGLREFLAQVEAGTVRLPSPDAVARYGRRSQAGQLAALLDGVTGGVA